MDSDKAEGLPTNQLYPARISTVNIRTGIYLVCFTAKFDWACAGLRSVQQQQTLPILALQSLHIIALGKND